MAQMAEADGGTAEDAQPSGPAVPPAVAALTSGGTGGRTRLRRRPALPVCLDAELTVVEGCQALAVHRISSAPVYSPEHGGFIGVLDYKDLAAYILEVFHKVPHDVSFDAEMEVTDVVKRAHVNRNTVPIKLLANRGAGEDFLHTVFTTDSLLDVLPALMNRHRVLVLEAAETSPPPPKFVGVLSQSDIIALVVSACGKTGHHRHGTIELPIASHSLRDLGLVRGTVHSVAPTDTVLDALKLMHECSVSSVAIVDRSHGYDRLVGSVSMSDVKRILAVRGRGWNRLYDPCHEFFAAIRRDQAIEEAGGDTRVPSFVVHPDTTLISSLEKMAATRAHRVWVVESTTQGAAVDKVVGVVSLSDIVPLLVAEAGLDVTK